MTRRWRPPHPARRINPRTCPTGKTRHRTQALAQQAMAIDAGIWLQPAPCDSCSGWHIQPR